MSSFNDSTSLDSPLDNSNNEFSKGKYTWKGKTLADFQFTDQSEKMSSFSKTLTENDSISLRSETYLDDNVKEITSSILGKLVRFDMIKNNNQNDRIDHVVDTLKQVKDVVDIISSLDDKPFVFVLNIQLPGNPPVNLLYYIAIPSFESLLLNSENPNNCDPTVLKKSYNLFQKFIDIPISKSSSFADYSPISKSWYQDIAWPTEDNYGFLPLESFQNQRFKLIPEIIDAPWAVKMAVPVKPCLMGQKIVNRYFRGENYFELDMHVGSSTIAATTIAVCRTYSNLLTCKIGLVVQGESEEELPEVLFGCPLVNKIDLEYASFPDEE